jgi:hypothetical protein
VDPVSRALIAPMVRRAALTQSCNEAWWLLGGLFVVALLLVPAIGRPRAKPPAGQALEQSARSAQ